MANKAREYTSTAHRVMYLCDYYATLRDDKSFRTRNPMGIGLSELDHIKEIWERTGSFERVLEETRVKHPEIYDKLRRIEMPGTKIDEEERDLATLDNQVKKNMTFEDFCLLVDGLVGYVDHLVSDGDEESARQIQRIRQRIPVSGDILRKAMGELIILKKGIEKSRSATWLLNQFTENPEAFSKKYDDKRFVDKIIVEARVARARETLRNSWEELKKRQHLTIDNWAGFMKHHKGIIEGLAKRVEEDDPNLAHGLRKKVKELKDWFPGWDKLIVKLADRRIYLAKFTHEVYEFVQSRIKGFESLKKDIISEIHSIATGRMKDIVQAKKRANHAVEKAIGHGIRKIRRRRYLTEKRSEGDWFAIRTLSNMAGKGGSMIEERETLLRRIIRWNREASVIARQKGIELSKTREWKQAKRKGDKAVRELRFIGGEVDRTMGKLRKVAVKLSGTVQGDFKVAGRLKQEEHQLAA